MVGLSFFSPICIISVYQRLLVAYDGIIVELKAVKALTVEHEAQLLNYLKATGLKVGYLLNFGSVGKLEWKRMVKTFNH